METLDLTCQCPECKTMEDLEFLSDGYSLRLSFHGYEPRQGKFHQVGTDIIHCTSPCRIYGPRLHLRAAVIVPQPHGLEGRGRGKKMLVIGRGRL